MAGNESLRCFRVVLHLDSIFQRTQINFYEIPKNAIFDILNYDLWPFQGRQNILRVENRPRPKHIQIPFQKIFPTLIRLTHFFNQKNLIFGHFTKISIFGQVLFLLFLLLFGVPQCCFFKSMIFQLSFAQKIIIISFLDQKLCQFEIWSIPCYLVIFDVITCNPPQAPKSFKEKHRIIIIQCDINLK